MSSSLATPAVCSETASPSFGLVGRWLQQPNGPAPVSGASLWIVVSPRHTEPSANGSAAAASLLVQGLHDKHNFDLLRVASASWIRGCIRASFWSAGSGAASEHRFDQLLQGLHQSSVLVSWFRGCIRASLWTAGSGAASEHRSGQLDQGLHQSIVLVSCFRGCIRALFRSAGSGAAS